MLVMLKMTQPSSKKTVDLSQDVPIHQKSMEEELYELEQELHKKADHLAKVQAAAPAKAPSEIEKIEQQVTDPHSQEFVRLMEFVLREQKRKSKRKDSHQLTMNLKKITQYDRVKHGGLDVNARQKGLQVNKAA
jgi:hypothetical protein